MRHRSKQAASHKSKVVLVRRLAAMAAGCTSENYSWRRVTLPPRDVAVPSPLKGLTAVFGMGTGGTPSLLSPRKLILRQRYVIYKCYSPLSQALGVSLRETSTLGT